MQNFTDKEQSERLVACGVPVSTAITKVNDEFYLWPLAELLEMLPKELSDYKMHYWYEPFQDSWNIYARDEPYEMNGSLQILYSENHWEVGYDWDGFIGRLPQSTELVEAIVLAIELLAKNGYDFSKTIKTDCVL